MRQTSQGKERGEMQFTLTQEQLAEVLAKHRAWLLGQTDGERANLQRANLQSANLQGADLRAANLQRADLRGAYLWGAKLQSADLQGADLQGAYLGGAYLQRADLRGADLRVANLRDAYLWGADLRGVNLQRADLRGAELHEHWQAIQQYRDLLWLGPLGSRDDVLLANLREGRLIAGCFEGTLDDFAAAALKTHGATVYGREYAATVEYLRALMAAREA